MPLVSDTRRKHSDRQTSQVERWTWSATTYRPYGRLWCSATRSVPETAQQRRRETSTNMRCTKGHVELNPRSEAASLLANNYADRGSFVSLRIPLSIINAPWMSRLCMASPHCQMY